MTCRCGRVSPAGSAWTSSAGVHGGIDPGRRAELIERFELDPTKRARDYSKGNRQKVALVAALASEVGLLVLDEPTSGLDPLMEQVFQEVIRERCQQGATVLLSSHILSEVEALADRVSIIRRGKTVTSGTLADLRRHTRTSVHALTGSAVESLDAVAGLEGLTTGRVDGSIETRFTVGPDALDQAIGLIHAAGIRGLTVEPPSLDDLFLRNYSDDEDRHGARMTGTRAMLAIQWRAQRRRLLVWVLATVGALAFTAIAVAQLYNTPEEIASYGQAVASDALVAINGQVEGIDTLGGIIQDEFGFIASFLMPLIGLALVAGMTRGEEESGRLEALLAGRIDRRVPVVSALVLVVAAVVMMDVGFVLSLLAAGIELGPAVLYTLALGMVTVVFAAFAAVCAQVVLHGRGVYALGFTAVGLSYLLRGVGDVNGTLLGVALAARLAREDRSLRRYSAGGSCSSRWSSRPGCPSSPSRWLRRRDLGAALYRQGPGRTFGLVLARPTPRPGAARAARLVPRVAGRIGRAGGGHGRAGAGSRRRHPRQPVAQQGDGDHRGRTPPTVSSRRPRSTSRSSPAATSSRRSAPYDARRRPAASNPSSLERWAGCGGSAHKCWS